LVLSLVYDFSVFVRLRDDAQKAEPPTRDVNRDSGTAHGRVRGFPAVVFV
jgi:hypothetical protein